MALKMKALLGWMSAVSSNVAATIIVLLIGSLGLWWFNGGAKNKDDLGKSIKNTSRVDSPQSIQPGTNRVKTTSIKERATFMDSTGRTSKNLDLSEIENETQKSATNEIINTTEKASFAVIARTDEKQDGRLARIIVMWLQESGPASQSILQNQFIQQGYFDEIFNGNTSVIKETAASEAAKYACLVKSTAQYENSTIDEGLLVAKCFYEIIIVETQTGKVVENFNHSIKSSGISKEMAQKRVEAELIEILKQKRITI